MNQQERIDKYLNQQLTPEEQERFEAEMITNPELAESVDFQQDLTAFFKQREPVLEAILAAEGVQHFEEKVPRKGFQRWRWLLPALLIFLGTGVWQWQRNATIEATSIESQSVTKGNSPFLVDTIQELPTVPSEELSPESAPKPPTDSKQKNKPTTKDKPPLIASLDPVDFQPNPIIESIMTEQVRDVGLLTKLITPTKDTIFQFDSYIPLHIIGTTPQAPPYQLDIYSNKIFDFENGYSVLSRNFSGKTQAGVYGFSFQANVSFSRGLYYLVLQSEKTGEILQLSRFSVK